MTVTAGMSLARINGLGNIWLEAAVPEAQAGAVQPGQAAEARLSAFPGEVFGAKVAAVLPESSRETRTLRVRIELPNPQQRLRAGMFAQVTLIGPRSEALVVPAEAIIRTGKRAIAYVVDAPGRYRPVDVEIGQELGDRMIVRRGLDAGQQVVASAQFLIDSEASLQGLTPAAVGAPAAVSASSPAAPVRAVVHSTTGTITALTNDSVTLQHAAVPTLQWPAMSMGFKLLDPKLKAGLQPRQMVQFSFIQQGDDYVITAIKPARPVGGTP
jgi:Cu(I)/Ag(I) efflux system membrane fusion protein